MSYVLPYLVLNLALLLSHGDADGLVGGHRAVLLGDSGALVCALLATLLAVPGVHCAPLHHAVRALGIVLCGVRVIHWGRVRTNCWRGVRGWLGEATAAAGQDGSIIRCRGCRSSVALTSDGSEWTAVDGDGTARGLQEEDGFYYL